MIHNEERHAPALYYLLGLFMLLILILQHLSAFSLKIGNAYPQLMLSVIVVISCLLGEWTGFWYALGAGLSLDTLAGRGTLFNTLVLVVIAVVAGLFYRYLFNKNLKAVFLGGFCFSLFYHLLKWLFLYVLRGESNVLPLLLRYFLPSAVYTALLVVPFYGLLRRLIRHYEIEP